MALRRACFAADRRVLFVVMLAAWCLSVLLIRTSPIVTYQTSKNNTQLADLKRWIGTVAPADGCTTDNGSIGLGERLAWGSDEDKSGHPRLCFACICDINSAEDDPFLNCDIHDCPVRRWSGKFGAFGPDHDCCTVCRTVPVTGRAEADTPEPKIATRVPMTGDIYRSEFRHLPAGLCRPQAPLAVLAVTSAPSAAEVRARFRRLYGADAAAAGLLLVFVLGRETIVRQAYNDFIEEDFYDVEGGGNGSDKDKRRTESTEENRHRFATIQQTVDEEATRFNDIIQSDVAEHYYHLSLKTVSLLDALRERCASARFVVKTDDDVLINVRLLAAEVASLPASSVIHGRRAGRLTPDRSGLGWYSSEREWPWPEYPPFVLGNGYLISGDALAPLYRTALRTRYHHLEDVFVTGVVAAAAGVTRHDWRPHCNSRADRVDLCTAALCALTHRVNYTAHGDELEDVLYGAQRPDVLAACTVNKTT